MPILNRGDRPAHWPARPVRTAAAPAPQASRSNRAWPAVIGLTAVIVFTVFLMQTTPLLALVMALATLVAGGILLTLVSGTAWLTQLRHLITDLRR
jgi:multidrug transporter EmrE-like cation transporter